MGDGGAAAAVVDTAVALPSLEQIEGWIEELQGDCAHLSDAQRVEVLRALERLKCCAEGAQAVLAGDLEVSQRARAEAAGVPPARAGRGIAEQVALARRESPARGQRHLGLARVLPGELPATLAALRGGWITEWRAMIIARETACLSLADRRRVDAEVAGDPAGWRRWGSGS